MNYNYKPLQKKKHEFSIHCRLSPDIYPALQKVHRSFPPCFFPHGTKINGLCRAFEEILESAIFYLQKMGVSRNRGFSPQIIHFNRVFHYKPSILGYPYFWKHPRWLVRKTGSISVIPLEFLGNWVNMIQKYQQFHQTNIQTFFTPKVSWGKSVCLCSTGLSSMNLLVGGFNPFEKY